jgi:hypothetical protein
MRRAARFLDGGDSREIPRKSPRPGDRPGEYLRASTTASGTSNRARRFQYEIDGYRNIMLQDTRSPLDVTQRTADETFPSNNETVALLNEGTGGAWRQVMRRHPRVMNALVRFSNVIAPVLSDGPDAASVALLAGRILETQRIRDVEVIPLTAEPEITETTLFAIRAGFADWHAVRLLIDQGKLPPDPRIHVRVHLNQAQWDKAGEIAYGATIEHMILQAAKEPRPRRKAAPKRQRAPRLLP